MEKVPLKLKLKLGSTPPAMETEANTALSEEEEEEETGGEEGTQASAAGTDDAAKERQHKKSKKKKKKKEREKDKHKHKRDRSTQESVADDDNPESKRLRGADSSSDPPPSAADVAAAMKELLTHLLKQLEKHDTNQFFLAPVTDLIAPGYSSIIIQPMCFISMRDKVAKGLYSSLQQYESDVKLMVANCLKYNGADTVYYSAGKKLLAAAQSVLGKEKLLTLMKDIPSIAILPADVIGFPLLAGTGEIGDSGGEDRTDSPNSHDSRSDDDSSDECEAQVLQRAHEAARAAALRLHNKKPTSTMGYLKTRADGSVGLSFLSGCEGSDAEATIKKAETNNSKPLNMGLVLGKLTTGSATLNNYHDDKRTMAKPVKPILYGSYSSFCPSYDSTFANLSKEESDLVRATYGNETAVQYAESICDFSRDCGMATTLVDQLLDLLTSGHHSRTRSNIATTHHHQMMVHQQRLEQQKQDDNKDVKPATDSLAAGAADVANLRSLGSIGIDMSFLDTIEHQASAVTNQQLSGTAELVQSLSAEQQDRLTRQSAQAQLVTSHPTQAEIHLAERLTSELVSVARQLPPSALLPMPPV